MAVTFSRGSGSGSGNAAALNERVVVLFLPPESRALAVQDLDRPPLRR